jgi:hypothetical protein
MVLNDRIIADSGIRRITWSRNHTPDVARPEHPFRDDLVEQFTDR